MNEVLYRILVFIAGLVLGTLFFGGLWFTVKKSVISKRPALWIFSSFFLRIGLTLIGFYFIAAGSWQRLLICLLGFIAARFVVVHFTRSHEIEQARLKKEDNYEA
ncbi:MAG: ATP synthase subunit I [Bacteroidia bacterium]|nr:ATP synthase subunit I [Bacteroidia bacterium]